MLFTRIVAIAAFAVIVFFTALVLTYPGTLFTRIPIDVAYIKWMQPFGDTVQARKYHQQTYCYSDGKHGGVDFGVEVSSVPVYASTSGKVVRKTATGIRLLASPYTIIYEHLDAIPSTLGVGDKVNPSTILGIIDFSNPLNAHLHLEVRRDNVLINPLVLLPAQNWDNIRRQEYPVDAKNRNIYHQEPINIKNSC